MRWIIISGAVHNFNMYAIGAFITPYLMRYHGLDIQQANLVSMLVYGVMGAPGLLIGGYIGERVFFADEATAVAAGYRPCAVCLPKRYAAWQATRDLTPRPPAASTPESILKEAP